MSIKTYQYLEVRKNAEGKPELFGKVGFQTMHDKLDRYTLSNLQAIERAMDSGELNDLEGNPAKDGAVIQIFVRVVKDKAEVEQVGNITSYGGKTVAVPPPAASTKPVF